MMGGIGHEELFDGNSSTCLDVSQVPELGMSEKAVPGVEINKDCLDKCSSEVHILVTVSNGQSCSMIPLYYQSMAQCGKMFWKGCHVAGDHVAAASQCELVCHYYNIDTQNCTFALWKKLTETYPVGYSLCDITLL